MSQIFRDTPSPPLPAPTVPPAPTPWPLWKAVLLSPFRPVGLLKRSDELSVKGVLLIHWVGLFVGAVVFIVSPQWEQAPISRRNFHPIWDVWRALRIDWTIVDRGRGVIYIDVYLLMIAAVMVAWVARDERVWQSIGRSVKRSLLLLPHVILLTSLKVVVMTGRDRMEAVHRRYNRFDSFPWYFEHQRIIVEALIWIGCVWALWVVITGFAQRRVVFSCRWPACCEQCGYSLMGLRDHQTCPECGHSVGLSRSWDARPGTSWDRRQERGTLTAWADTLMTVLRPSAVGRQARLLSADGSCHQLLLSLLPVVALIHGLLALGIVVYGPDRRYSSDPIPWDKFIRIWVWSSMVGACVVTVIVTGSATLVGQLVSRYTARNLLSIAAQGASNLLGLVLFWLALSAVLIIVVVANRDAIEAFCRTRGLSDDVVFTVLVVVPVVLGVLHYWIALWRYTMAARHANW